ncbi:MbcA/ParS/Xre antitoxin family protein [Neptunomonas phycophila]|uniref:MbcA/ParS/Xre antitoxin family protein n=1 Tax=Neptunomonas phycophila TaxID=1572645 RepID=UPI001BEACDD2|nr:MbcA/ParS/Xre antitoxin family protein [Neptunomonas phycophila]MBT3146617.1 DUF2384 domain-containing protein [Neptunomonas phycophila]MDO6782922.1 MbcA/ParS/Xre antitoxin family protein [Neptunomonas phycophila]
MSAVSQTQPDPSYVLAKALLNAGEQLQLSQAELAAVVGLHRTGISRLKKSMQLDPNSKTGELALLLIRVARALYVLSGGDSTWTQHFMRNPNTMTAGIPAEQVQSVQGLSRVLQYVDAIRGKI